MAAPDGFGAAAGVGDNPANAVPSVCLGDVPVSNLWDKDPLRVLQIGLFGGIGHAVQPLNHGVKGRLRVVSLSHLSFLVLRGVSATRCPPPLKRRAKGRTSS